MLFSAAVDGSSPPVNLGYGTFPTVSPSGDRLAIVQYDAVVVRDLASGAEQSYPDTAHEGTLIDLAWSTDGGSLYYVRYEGTTSQLVRLPLDGGEPEVVATSESGLRFPLGGADGTATVVEQCCADGSESNEPSVIVGVGGSTVREELPSPLLARRAHEVFELRLDSAAPSRGCSGTWTPGRPPAAARSAARTGTRPGSRAPVARLAPAIRGRLHQDRDRPAPRRGRGWPS